jgi:hypothetical protein
MERFTNDCIEMAKLSKEEDEALLLGLEKKPQITAQELHQSLMTSLKRMRNGIEFILLMRRRVARLRLEVAKSTTNYNQQAGEAAIKAEVEKCNMHIPTLSLEDIIAEMDKKFRYSSA